MFWKERSIWNVDAAQETGQEELMGGRMKEMVMQMGSNSSTRSCHGSLPLDRLYHSKCELHQKKKKTSFMKE